MSTRGARARASFLGKGEKGKVDRMGIGKKTILGEGAVLVWIIMIKDLDWTGALSSHFSGPRQSITSQAVTHPLCSEQGLGLGRRARARAIREVEKKVC